MIKLRPADIRDSTLLAYWDEKPHVIASDPDGDEDWEDELSRDPAWREQLVAELDGRPIGFIQIIDPHLEESRYWGEVGPGKRAIDIWIGEEEDLGKGYGTIMMNLALERCFSEQAVTAVLIDPLESNHRAIAFYRKIGFTFLEKRVFGKATCEVLIMKRDDWENNR